MTTKILILVFATCLVASTAKTQTKPALKWPDKLDAVIAAPKNHNVVYEDSNIRILQVICPPGAEEPVHTHQYKSTMWFTQSARFKYYTYAIDAKKQLVKKDSVEIKGFPSEALNKG
jgi:hypothetical protein